MKISVHDQISEKNVALVIKGGKLTAKTGARDREEVMTYENEESKTDEKTVTIEPDSAVSDAETD